MSAKRHLNGQAAPIGTPPVPSGTATALGLLLSRALSSVAGTSLYAPVPFGSKAKNLGGLGAGPQRTQPTASDGNSVCQICYSVLCTPPFVVIHCPSSQFSTVYSMASTIASHDASMMFSLTPTLPKYVLGEASCQSMVTRTLAAVSAAVFTTRTL